MGSYREPCWQIAIAIIIVAQLATALGHAEVVNDPPFESSIDTPVNRAQNITGPLPHLWLIPHSHCDLAWTQDFESYYRSKVSAILTGAVRQLAADPKRRFCWSETAFFQRWWIEQPDSVRSKVRELVRVKQLEFVGGGWAMHDEVIPTPFALIHQMRAGHEWLLQHLGVRPRVAWQIDPFGHSIMTPSLWAVMGLDAFVGNRVHYRVKYWLKAHRQLEFIWHGGDVGAAAHDSDMFTHILSNHYSFPDGVSAERDDFVPITPENIASRASSFVDDMFTRLAGVQTRHMLIPMGDDFTYVDAAGQFKLMDALLAEIQSNPTRYGCTASYGTLSEYFAAVFHEATVPGAMVYDSVYELVKFTGASLPSPTPAADQIGRTPLKFPVMQGEFLPYADPMDVYWGGVFTTRPSIKIVARR